MTHKKPLERVILEVIETLKWDVYQSIERREYRNGLQDCLDAMNGKRPARWKAEVWMHKYEREDARKLEAYKAAMTKKEG